MSDVIQIIHVALQLDTGGMERLLVEFARHANPQRFALQFVTLGARGPIADEVESCGWPVTALHARPGLRPSLVYRLARLFHDQRADIIHAHNTKPLLYAGPAARLAGVRGVVYTRHGQRKGSTRRQNLLVRLASRCADHIVCVSDESRQRCQREGVDSRSIRTIWNGIDRERFQFSGPSVNGPAVFMGRLTPEKDVATLLRATAIVVEQDDSFRMTIAGDGPCRAELAALTESLKLERHVQFLGEVRDVTSVLHSASMFVLPSLTEGLPLTVLEAMACGLPVVATCVGGTPEAVIDGQTGLLVAPNSPKQLAGALLRIWGNADLGLEMGSAGHQRIDESFDVRTMVSHYESLYQDTLQQGMSLAA